MANEALEAKRAAAAFRETGRLDGADAAIPVALAHPFNHVDVAGYHSVLRDLAAAIPDLERRVTIAVAGRDGNGEMWVGYAGYWCGQFAAPFMDIPPTQRMVAMRFHDFVRIENGAIVEMQSLWDIPELIMQSGVWPLSPSLGREWHVPGPSSQDGLRVEGDGTAAMGVVEAMLASLGNDPAGTPPEVMAQYWHANLSWYGPSGIGTARGINGFRTLHQAPFLGAMPNRQAFVDKGHFFAEGGYVGFTAFPGMAATVSGGTWLGMPGAGQEITMRSLDFWRVQDGKIIENWVLLDMLHIYAQLGVDVLARMRELVR